MNTDAVPLRQDAEVMGLVGFAHGVSHFFHLVIPTLFPWLMPAFGLSYTEAGLMMTIFFVVSALGQASSGFLVDRVGPVWVLVGALSCLTLSALTLASATHPAMLYMAAALAGIGNCPFHPADFSLLNHRVSPRRLGYAFSVHGLTGSAGYVAAPLAITAIATAWGWRDAALTACLPALLALAGLVLRRDSLHVDHAAHHEAAASGNRFAFLSSGTVWLCMLYFFITTLAFGGLQNFGPSALSHFYQISIASAAAALAAYLAGGAIGILIGGVIAARRTDHEGVIALSLAASAAMATLIATPWLPASALGGAMLLMGIFAGLVGPSRDLLVRRAATGRFGKAAYGRVYGFVYSGLDVGFSLSPLIFGPLMDQGHFSWVLGGIAAIQVFAILTVLRVGKDAKALA